MRNRLSVHSKDRVRCLARMCESPLRGNILGQRAVHDDERDIFRAVTRYSRHSLLLPSILFRLPVTSDSLTVPMNWIHQQNTCFCMRAIQRIGCPSNTCEFSTRQRSTRHEADKAPDFLLMAHFLVPESIAFTTRQHQRTALSLRVEPCI